MVLVDRVSEMETLGRLLDAVRAGSSKVVVVRGEAGIGKTAILRETADRAAREGMSVARVAGVQAELDFEFAGLHQLLVPFLSGLPTLPAPQRAALEAVFGVAARPAPDRFLVGLATLTLLADAAEAQPVLCVVDDAQWLDRVSLQMLAFVCRRLLAERAGVLFGLRTGEDAGQVLEGFPQLDVGRLAEDAGRELLQISAGAEMAEPVARRALADAAGYPLALIELGRDLAEDSSTPLRARETPGRPGERLQQLYAERVRALPGEAKTLLLVAAAEQLGDPDRVQAAAGSLGVDLDVQDLPGVRRMLSLRPRVAFTHPLMRAAAYWQASADERRRAHAALAAVADIGTDPDRRAWHLAEATIGPDETVAAELEASAARARDRGGWESEAAFFKRAAELSTDHERGAERRLAAAEASLLAGNPAEAATLAGRAAPSLGTALGRARAKRVQAAFLLASGRAAEAVELLVEASREMGPSDPRLARDTLLRALLAAQGEDVLGAKGGEVLLVADRALPRPATVTPSDLLLDGYLAMFGGRTREAYAMFRQAVASFPPDDFPSVDEWALAAGLLIDHEPWRAAESTWVPALRDRGAVTALLPILHWMAHFQMLDGRLTTAEASVAEGRALAEASGNRFYLPGFPTFQVWLLGLRGEAEEGRALAARLLAEPVAPGWKTTASLGLSALELGAGRYQAALEAALRGRIGWLVYSPEDAVEAAMRVQRADLARGAVEEFEPVAEASGTPWALGLLERCKALVADSGAEDHYLLSIGQLERTQLRYPLARTRLVYGEWLRRERRRLDARKQLRAALEAFEHMGARGFAERTSAELAATGEHARRRTDDAQRRLTPQEHQIAQLAAAGATNRDIASKLFLSAATVEYHLRKVYRELNVTSRVGLIPALPEAYPET